MSKFLFILSFSLTVSVKAQTYNNSYLLNKPAAVFRGLLIVDDTLVAHGYVAESFPPYPVKYIVAKFDFQGNPVVGYSAMLDSFTDYWTQNHFIISSDNCFAFAGTKNTGQGGLFFKITNRGAIVFAKQYTDSIALAYGYHHIVELHDSSFILLGYSSANGLTVDLTITKTDPSGNELWRKRIGVSNLTEMPFGLFQLNNGNILIGAGKGEYDFYRVNYSNTYLIELDTAGNIISSWLDTTNRTYGPTAYLQQSNGDAIYSTMWLDTVISLGGAPQSYGNLVRGYIVREDSLHHKIWELKLGHRSSVPALFQMKKLSDGNYLAVGGTGDTTYSDGQPYKNTGWLVKFSEDGNVIWQRRYFKTTDMPGQTNYLYDFVELSNGDIVACGERIDQFANYPQQGWLIRLDANGCLYNDSCGVLLEIEEPPAYAKIYCFPNPFNDNITISFSETASSPAEIQVSDMAGRILTKVSIPPYQTTFNIETEKFAKGIYVAALSKEGKIISIVKIVKQ